MTAETIDTIREALAWFDIENADWEDCDICEDGSVWYGLTQILPRGSVPAGCIE